jgi:hypothetical protein
MLPFSDGFTHDYVAAIVIVIVDEGVSSAIILLRQYHSMLDSPHRIDERGRSNNKRRENDVHDAG